MANEDVMTKKVLAIASPARLVDAAQRRGYVSMIPVVEEGIILTPTGTSTYRTN